MAKNTDHPLGVIAVQVKRSTYSVGDELSLHPNSLVKYVVLSIICIRGVAEVKMKRSKDQRAGIDYDEIYSPTYVTLTLLKPDVIIEAD
ncbi:MAG: hypothetical protein ACTSVR_03215 [Candidatus Thorarchaeota archaeon]